MTASASKPVVALAGGVGGAKLIDGLAQILGRHAVLPMAVIYCFLHTGKPPGEAISSIFGGYILGVIAYETKSIWGGIIVHVGIAWMMEVIGFTQKAL